MASLRELALGIRPLVVGILGPKVAKLARRHLHGSNFESLPRARLEKGACLSFESGNADCPRARSLPAATTFCA